MTYAIVPSKRFEKAVRKHQKSGKGYVLKALAVVIDLLAASDDRALFTLGTRWRDHALRGDKDGIRELHLSQDDLLLYAVDEELQIIKLLDIVNHEQPRRK